MSFNLRCFIRDLIMVALLLASTTATGRVPDAAMWCVGPGYEASEPAAMCTGLRVNRQHKGNRGEV